MSVYKQELGERALTRSEGRFPLLAPYTIVNASSSVSNAPLRVGRIFKNDLYCCGVLDCERVRELVHYSFLMSPNKDEIT